MNSISFTVSRAFTAMYCHAVTLRKNVLLPRQQRNIDFNFNKVANAVKSTTTASRLPVKSAVKICQILPQHISLPKSPLGNVSSAIRAAAAVKIQQRHERILALLTPVNQRPKQQSIKATRSLISPVTATTKTTTTSTRSSRSLSSQLPAPAIASRPRRHVELTINFKLNYRQSVGLRYFRGHITQRVPISDSNLATPSRIPSVPTSFGPRRTFTPRRYPPVVVIPPRRRGTLPYCPGRPCALDSAGNIYRCDYGLPWDGSKCSCHGEVRSKHQYWIRPEDWATTSAEEDVNPLRPRKVRFDTSETVTVFERWYEDAWGDLEDVVDPATKADDDAEILGLDLSTLSLGALPSSPPPPVKSDFQATWEELMAEGFDDDED